MRGTRSLPSPLLLSLTVSHEGFAPQSSFARNTVSANVGRERPLRSGGWEAAMRERGPARARIEDVAAAAGVSIMSVSRAMRGVDGVSAATRARILEIAGNLGYAPSRVARSRSAVNWRRPASPPPGSVRSPGFPRSPGSAPAMRGVDGVSAATRA
ncbi:MAG: LacI family DNA-binding transcriptional regulator, partial [Pseudomonadota bacterium]